MIARRIVQAEEIQAVLDGAAEGNDDPRHRRSVRLGDVAAILGYIAVTGHVSHHVLLQRLLPCIVVTGCVGTIQQAEQFGAEREDRAILVGVVNAQPALGHGEIRVHLSQGAREPGIA